MANVIAFFASDESEYMTGSYASVDGDLLLEDNNDNSNNALVQILVDKFGDAFNSHDPKMLGSLLTEDGEWTDVIGYTMMGRKEIEHQHTYPFITVLKEARLDVKSYRSK